MKNPIFCVWMILKSISVSCFLRIKWIDLVFFRLWNGILDICISFLFIACGVRLVVVLGDRKENPNEQLRRRAWTSCEARWDQQLSFVIKLSEKSLAIAKFFLLFVFALSFCFLFITFVEWGSRLINLINRDNEEELRMWSVWLTYQVLRSNDKFRQKKKTASQATSLSFLLSFYQFADREKIRR